MYSVLHMHFESALRVARQAHPERLAEIQAVYESPRFAGLTPAERLTLLWSTAVSLTDGENIFTEAMFRAIVRDALEELRSEEVEHVDLRIGPSVGRWGWMRTAADGIDVFREELVARPGVSVAFVAGVSMIKSEHDLDAVFDAIEQEGELQKRIVGVDVDFYADDLAKFDRYVGTMLNLQSGGMKLNIHLGELFSNEVSRYVLSRLIPDRIGHGVRLLDNPELVALLRDRQVCLDMCPTSNCRLGVHDWRRGSPASRALALGLPVSINTDDPILLGARIAAEYILAGLTDRERENVLRFSRQHRYAGK